MSLSPRSFLEPPAVAVSTPYRPVAAADIVNSDDLARPAAA
jgi:hypothetical protein